jgi:hypothetical protein
LRSSLLPAGPVPHCCRAGGRNSQLLPEDPQAERSPEVIFLRLTPYGKVFTPWPMLCSKRFRLTTCASRFTFLPWFWLKQNCLVFTFGLVLSPHNSVLISCLELSGPLFAFSTPCPMRFAFLLPQGPEARSLSSPKVSAPPPLPPYGITNGYNLRIKVHFRSIFYPLNLCQHSKYIVRSIS